LKTKLNFYFDTFVVFPNLEFYTIWIEDFHRWCDIEVPKMLAGEKYKKCPQVEGYPTFVNNFEDFEENLQIVSKRSDLKFEDKLFAIPVVNGISRFILNVIKKQKYKTGVDHFDLELRLGEISTFKLDPTDSWFSSHGVFTDNLMLLNIPFTVNLIGEQINDKILGKKWYVIDYDQYIPIMFNEIHLYKEVIDYIRDNDINLMFLTPQEEDRREGREKVYNNLVKFCISRGLSLNRIFYLNHTFLNKTKSYKIKPYMNKSKIDSINHYSVLGCAFYQNFHEKCKPLMSYKPSVDLEKKKRSKHFYYVIGQPKYERIEALKYFYSKGLLDKMNWASKYKLITTDKNFRPFKINLEEFNKITPKLFEEDLKNNIATSIPGRDYEFRDHFYIPKKIVEDSYISIVFSTEPRGYSKLYKYGEGTNMHIDEKILKPIISLHPFICYGNMGTLDYFRDIGYETFPEIFDESYDEIYDHIERLEFVIKQIEKISKLSLDKVHDLYNKVYPKLVKNRDLLLSMDIKKEYESWFEVE
jgi:hypothetical protein